jgi:hypothetical protein
MGRCYKDHALFLRVTQEKIMNKKIYTTAAMVLGGLIVGATVEHLRLTSSTPEPAEAEPEVIHHVRKVARESTGDAGQDKLIASLNAKVAALTAELNEHRPVSENPPVTVEQKKKGGDDRKRESWNDRMERMKTEEPEKYAEMQQRREEFKERMTQRSNDRREFLASIKPDNMNDEQLANHARLVELTDKIDATMKLMMSGEVENTHDLRHEMYESFGEMGDLYASERQYLLEETAAAVGYKGDEAALFTAHISDIIENTTMQHPMMGGGRGGRGGPPGGGGGR